jgi:hypothetical protein
MSSHNSAQPSPTGSLPMSVHRGDAGAKKRKSEMVWHSGHNGKAPQLPFSSVVSRAGATTKNRVVMPGL